MTKFNDFNLTNWKELTDIETDSLWIINKRDNTNKHDGFYHGNFVPQIPRQLIKRFTKQNEIVLDLFLGSGTTMFECETLKRSCIGVDINNEIISYVQSKITNSYKNSNFYICLNKDSKDINTYTTIKNILYKNNKKNVQLIILHPPYFNIIHFTNNKNDLSNSNSIDNFLSQFDLIIKNALNILETNRYLSIIIGDIYMNSEWIPLGFYCLQICINNKLKLKSIIVKNMEGNRAKTNQEALWRYRALSSDYYIFKHEYILLFKKVV